MKFDIYGRFQVDVQRENDGWVVFRSAHGKRVRLNDVVVPSDVLEHELATYLDDIFHELAGVGQRVDVIRD